MFLIAATIGASAPNYYYHDPRTRNFDFIDPGKHVMPLMGACAPEKGGKFGRSLPYSPNTFYVTLIWSLGSLITKITIYGHIISVSLIQETMQHSRWASTCAPKRPQMRIAAMLPELRNNNCKSIKISKNLLCSLIHALLIEQ
jgi:hypothetical protein